MVYSTSMQDHHKHLQLVFDRLHLKLTKCHFGIREVKLLGYNPSGEGIQTDSEKVVAINNLGNTETVPEV